MQKNIILAVAAGVLAVPTILTYVAESTIYDAPAIRPMMFDGFTPDQVDRIAIQRPRAEPAANPAIVRPESGFENLLLLRQGDRWVIGAGEMQGAPVKAELVEQRVFAHLQRIEVDADALIARDADQQALEQALLTQETAYIISCQQRIAGQPNARPRVLAELLVGRDVSGGGRGQDAVPGFLVARSGTNDIYLYEVPYWERMLDPLLWVDKVVHNYGNRRVVRFSVKNSKTGEPLVFELAPGSDGTWTVEETPPGFGAIRQGEVAQMVSRFSHIQAQTMIGLATSQVLIEHGLLPPGMEVTATLEDGSTYTLHVGNKVPDKNEYYMMAPGLNFLRTVPEWVVLNFQLGPEELFDPDSVEPSLPAGAEGHWIHSFEEDSPEGEVYRRQGYAFPAGERGGFEIRGDGVFVLHPVDAGAAPVTGRWTVQPGAQIDVGFPGGELPAQSFRILSVDADAMLVRR